MDEIKRAMLGDREAQRRLTERGIALPCPMCKKTVVSLVTEAEVEILDENYPDYELRSKRYVAVCNALKGGCGLSVGGEHKNINSALKAWNTRPQILTDEEMERLEEME